MTLHQPTGDTTRPGERKPHERGARSNAKRCAGQLELCAGGTYDATPLVGQRVRIATRRDQIQAASCQGNPDCADSETVDLVVAILPAP